MAGQPEEAPDPKSSKTFRDAVDNGKKARNKADISFAEVKKVPFSFFKGEPALIMSPEEEDQLAEEYQYTLVGKFSWGRPVMNTLRKEILNAAFHGEVHVGLLDSRHVLFKFENEADFQRMWLRKVWFFAGFQARLFRWTKDFRPEVESSVTPVWICFPMLPIHLFNPEKLYTLASVAGKPLKLDTATASAKLLARPSEARVCVEMDVLKNIPERVWVGSKEQGTWQKLEIEERPSYCTKCKKLGHSVEDCQPQTKTQKKSAMIALTKKKKSQKEWTVVNRTKGLQIREREDTQMNQRHRMEVGGKEMAKESIDKGKGMVPGSCPQICREGDEDTIIIEQGENSIGNFELQMRPEEKVAE